MYQFKAKYSEIGDINWYELCFGNISNSFINNSLKINGIKRNCNFFSVDFNPIDTNDILDIHKYLVK